MADRVNVAVRTEAHAALKRRAEEEGRSVRSQLDRELKELERLEEEAKKKKGAKR